MILAAKRLSHFRIEESDERESSERFGYEHIGDFAVLAKVIAQVIGSDIFSATANKHFTGDLRTSSL